MTIIAVYNASPTGAVAVLRAVEEGVLRGRPVVIVDAENPTRALDEETLAAVTASQAELIAESGLSVASESSLLPDPSDAVIQVAQLHDADLIVLGLRRRSPVGKLILGSTAQRILLGATCPVLAVYQ